ncbi:PREDICTED: TNF receptor-associated factor 4-like [Acropora digitifera]|uniref:TNF receptor-associated factor 4-like n=1 Tax=Acropora digitifera TaxID=70779 RepID=UPI00077AC44E|nr:PREDICTED: TNF receptor-associated factor 4-like [Acropora digitifera]
MECLFLFCYSKEHSLECRRRPIDCSNGCGQVVPREEITAHKDVDCPETLISCQYDFLGCRTQIKRCEMKDHLEEKLRGHFEMSVDKLSGVQDECRILRREMEQIKLNYFTVSSQLASLEKEVFEVKLKHKDIETSAPFIWKVTNFWERVCKAKTDKEIRVESDSFYVGPQGYKMKLAMYPNGTKEARNAHISLYIALMKGRYDAILPWPFKYKVTLTIVDQNPDLIKRQNFVKSFVPEPGWRSMQRPTSEENERRGFGRFFAHEKLRAGSYVLDDTLFIKFEVSPGNNTD